MNVNKSAVFLIENFIFLRTFADYTNLFGSDDDVNTPFTTVNKETQKKNKKLISNKLHLNSKIFFMAIFHIFMQI